MHVVECILFLTSFFSAPFFYGRVCSCVHPHPRSPPRINRHQVYRCQGRPEAAVKCFHAAIQHSPTFAAAYAALGAALLDSTPYGATGGDVLGGSSGNFVTNPFASQACCSRALSLDPDCLSALATLLLGQQITCTWPSSNQPKALLLPSSSFSSSSSPQRAESSPPQFRSTEEEKEESQLARLIAATTAELGLAGDTLAIAAAENNNAIGGGNGNNDAPGVGAAEAAAASTSSPKPAGSATAAARAKKAQANEVANASGSSSSSGAAGTGAAGSGGALAYSLPGVRTRPCCCCCCCLRLPSF